MKNLIISLLFLLPSILLSQTNYYISNNGDDVNLGTSIGESWETIAKVNSQTFSSGDSILFKSGDIWREALIIPSSGTISNYITFSNYSTGDKPKIYGSEVLNSFTAHPTLSNIYRGDQLIYINPSTITSYDASIFFKMDDSTTWGDVYKTSLTGLSSNYEYAWQNDTIYFYYDASIINIDSVEVTQRARGININEEYITIDGFEMKYHASRNIGTGIWPEVTSQGINIRNCILAYTAAREAGVGYGIQLFHSNMLIENNIIHDNGRRNISLNIVDQTSSVTMRDIIVQDNILSNGWHTTGVDLAIQGRGHSVRNITIRRNKIIEDYNFAAFKANQDYNITMTFIENNGDSADIDTVYFYNNIIQNSFRTGLQLNGIANAFVFYNTFSGKSDEITNNGHGLIYNGRNYDGEGGTLFAMNNIFYNYGDRDINLTANIWGASGGVMKVDTLDYNLHYVFSVGNYLFSNAPGDISYRYTDSVAMRTAGYGVHSFLNPIDPLFVDTLTNFNLQTGSPAIGNATPITSLFTPIDITTDIEGNARSATTPTIGAYEGAYSIDSTATDIITFTIPSQVSSVVTVEDSAVVITMPPETDVTDLTPTITLSTGATVSPLSGVSQDFTSEVAYTVTSLKSNTQEWGVSVIVQPTPPSPTSTTTYLKNRGKYLIYRSTGQRLNKRK